MTTPLIALEQVYKAYGPKAVLVNLNLAVYAGEHVVVLGRSGSGKSVAIKCIAGLTKIDQGVVRLMGHDITHSDENALSPLRQKMGFLFQSAALYDSMTVGDNLAFTLHHNQPGLAPEVLEKKVRATLQNVGLESAINLMPGALSGGMRKRIGLARALIIDPEVLLYDEPTAGLDPITAKEITDLMLRIKADYHPTAVIITHDLACAAHTADRIVVLHEGQIIQSGTYEALAQSEHPMVHAFFNP